MDDNANPLDGKIWEVAIWSAGLVSEEIAMLAAGYSPLMLRADHLEGYWPLYGVASPEIDLSSNGNNAALVGAPGYADQIGVQPLPIAA